MHLGRDKRDAVLYGPSTRASPPAFVVRRFRGLKEKSLPTSSHSIMSRSLPSLMRTPTLGHDLPFDDDSSDDDDISEITDVSKRRGFMRVQARPPTVLAGISFLNNTHEEGLERYLPTPEPKPLPAPLSHRFSSPAKIARLERSISLTSDRLRTEQSRLHGKKANRGLEIVDRLILRDLRTKHVGIEAAAAKKKSSRGKIAQSDEEEPALTLSLPPNPIEVKLIRAQGVLRRLKRQQSIQKQAVSSMDEAFEVDIQKVQSDIQQYRRDLHAQNCSMYKLTSADDDDEYGSLLRNLKSLDSGGERLNVGASPASPPALPLKSSSHPYEGTDLLHFAREKQWRGPLPPFSSEKSELASQQHRKVMTPLTPSMGHNRSIGKTPGGGGGLLRGILRSPSTAGSSSSSRKRISWSPMKTKRTYNDGSEIPAFDRIPNTADMGLRTYTRRTEFRKTMGRVTGKEAKKKLARRRLSNAAASARAIARIRLAAKRAQKRQEEKKERTRRASLGFAGPAPRPNVLAQYAKK